ncbi:hypothetical protein [Methanobrevibacter sp.]|uniref:hypothetical protein n=1 Tax=Methanobrevibacter sp. TaxID=66852 RepID=UPI003865366B
MCIERLNSNRQVEADNIREEVAIVEEYKDAFDEGLVSIYNGEAERVIIDAENNSNF